MSVKNTYDSVHALLKFEDKVLVHVPVIFHHFSVEIVEIIEFFEVCHLLVL
jgi:hypothetical protein|tara:strand:- start:126 stop:278 length:153 start_codon:yes stop_codon:yes gene_type:complete